ncbi:iron chaperone [Enterococcus sp. AZ126]|uniref:iron chaperone n=1 Tax=Enterococcus sp. AZ126 TaxID=2774635 RepID=UPI003F2507A9
MKDINDFLLNISELEHRQRVEELVDWTIKTYPQFSVVIKWNQPMFTDHGTFIIAYSTSKKHISIAPETVTILAFKDDIEKSGYQHTDNLFKITWDQPIDYSLLKKIIDYNIQEKINYTKFWRE